MQRVKIGLVVRKEYGMGEILADGESKTDAAVVRVINPNNRRIADKACHDRFVRNLFSRV